MRRLAVIALCLFGASMPVHAGDPGSAGAVFLKLGIDSRAIGMGEAQTGLADNVNSLFWNPAGLDRLKGLEVAFMHNFHFMGMHHDYFGLASPVANRGTIGVALYYWTSGTIEGMDMKGLPTSDFSAWDLSAGLYYANRLSPNLSAGGGVKAVMEKNEEEGGAAYAGDIGLLFTPPVAGLSLGLSLQNLGTKMRLIEEGYSLPLTARAGAGFTIPGAPVSLAADIAVPVDDSPALSAGAEYRIAGLFALRAGYKTGSDLGASAGVRAGCGFSIGIVGLDYAFTPYGELGSSHRISLLVKT
jgi:hypothetical protein